MELIDKAVVVAEIERRISVLKTNESVISMLAGGMFVNEFKDLLSFLDTLETKEVDLKKELDYDDYIAFFKEHPEYNNGDWGFDECWVFAKYFFELGLKAQKGE